MSRLRLAAFAAAGLLLIAAWHSQRGGPWCLAGIAAIAAFVTAVAYHEHVAQPTPAQSPAPTDQRAGDCAFGPRLGEGPLDTRRRATSTPGHGADLDLFGHASLFHFLCAAKTPIGIRILRDWLLEPALPAEIKLRQRAVAELAPHLELRDVDP